MSLNDLTANVAILAPEPAAAVRPAIYNTAFRYTPPDQTNVLATFKKHGFVPPSRATQRRMAVALNGWDK